MKIVMGAAAVALLGGGMLAWVAFSSERSSGTQLIGDDYGKLRREALDMFPRGKPITEVKAGLAALGFQCAPTRLLLANVNAASVQCDSAGRGYPTASRLQVTIMARNGALSDIAIGDGIGIEADARTPDPQHTPLPN